MPFASWAPTMGGFLSWLHQFPISDAEALGVPRQDVAELIAEVRSDALDDFALLNDLASEHVLCDPVRQAVTGIIDWSEIASAIAQSTSRDFSTGAVSPASMPSFPATSAQSTKLY